MALTEYDELTGYNPIRRKGSVNWLKYEIKAATDEFNKRYRQLELTGKVPSQLEEARERIYEYSGYSTPKRSTDVLSAGVSNRKKDSLIRQYRELRTAIKSDVWSDEAAKLRTDKEEKAWEQFNNNQVLNWNYSKWKAMVDIFGNMDAEILRGFGYEDHSNHSGSSTANGQPAPQYLEVEELTELPTESSKGKVSNSSLVSAFSFAYDRGLDLYTLMERVQKRTKGQGKEQYQMIDELYKEIGEELKRRKGEQP